MEYPELKDMPKCQDGRICKGFNNGFMFLQFTTEDGGIVWKFVCGDCYLQARKDEQKRRFKENLEQYKFDK